MKNEIWKDIPGYEGKYQVSNLGNVLSLNYEGRNIKQLLKPRAQHTGYLRVGLSNNGQTKDYLIHKLVATVFINNPYNYKEVNHIDEDKTNNCVSNLEWCTRRYNMNYGTIKTKIGQPGKHVACYDKQGNLIKTYNSLTETEQDGFTISGVSTCCRGRIKSHYGYSWKFVDK